MSHSIYGGRIDFDPTQLDDEDPVEAGMWRTLANNALHFADEDAQVRVTFSDATIAVTPVERLQWTRMATFGPWDHRLGPDGIPYPMRFRIAGSSETDTRVINLRLVVAGAASLTRYGERGATGGSNVALVSTSSDVAAWLTPSSGPTTLLTFTTSHAAEALRTMSTIDGVGGDAVGVETCLMSAAVFGRFTDSDAQPPDPYLNGLYLAEYVGA